ncbi:MAG: hypothetical protein NTY19_24460, partial [Planctomycetota bacterium]|nr:hypothetical protein [Planctomycetota bacterium]
MNQLKRAKQAVQEGQTRRHKARQTRQTRQRRLLIEALEDRRLLLAGTPNPDELPQILNRTQELRTLTPDQPSFGASLLQDATPDANPSANGVPTSYEYVAPISYAYAGPNDVNLKSQHAAPDLPIPPPDEIVGPPTPLPQHVSTAVLGTGGDVVFVGDAGNANELVLSVDDQGRLQHNLGGQFGFASNIDLDATVAGIQSRQVTEIRHLTYSDLDASADDAVTIDAGLLDLGGGSLTISAGTITVSGSVRAAEINLQARLLDNSGDLSSSGAIGGRVSITAERLLNSGRIAADGTAGAGGEISILLDERLMQTEFGLISASGVGGSGGRITILAGAALQPAGSDGTAVGGVFLSGTIRADGSGVGAVGGEITISGQQLDLYAAQLLADGDAGGGRVLVGQAFQPDGGSQAGKPDLRLPRAQTVTVNPAALLSANAVQRGSGGQVLVWSDGETTFAGRITARGGADGGNGGAVEVSGLAGLAFDYINSAEPGPIGGGTGGEGEQVGRLNVSLPTSTGEADAAATILSAATPSDARRFSWGAESVDHRHSGESANVRGATTAIAGGGLPSGSRDVAYAKPGIGLRPRSRMGRRNSTWRHSNWRMRLPRSQAMSQEPGTCERRLRSLLRTSRNPSFPGSAWERTALPAQPACPSSLHTTLPPQRGINKSAQEWAAQNCIPESPCHGEIWSGPFFPAWQVGSPFGLAQNGTRLSET